jgi:hypothetical protein
MAQFSIKRLILPFKGALPSDKIKLTWDKADAFEAFKRGYFIERDYHSSVARVLPLRGSRFLNDAEIINDATARALYLDEHAVKLIKFVAQQDEHRCLGAWGSPTIERCHIDFDASKMRWIKAYAEKIDQERNPALKRNQGGRPPGPTGYAMDRRAVARMDTEKGAERQRQRDHERRLRSKYGVAPLSPAERTANRLAGVAKRQEIARRKREMMETMSADYYAIMREEWRKADSKIPFKTWLRRAAAVSVADTD